MNARKPVARGQKQQGIDGSRGQVPAVRAPTLDPGAHGLERYFSELQGLPLLDAEQEVALAREIEALEIEHWCALLSYRPALDVVVAAAAAELPEGAQTLEALRKREHARRRRNAQTADRRDPRWTQAVTAAAEQLRSLDVSRAALTAAETAVRDAFGDDGRARAYLARVGRAGRAQQRAKGRFVAGNLRLVITMARRYDRSLLPLADLIQEGNLGLMRAVERFDYRRGYRFSTYASWWIRHSLNRALSDKARLVRIPVHALDDMSRVARARSATAAKTGVVPSTRELANELGMSEEKIDLLATDVIKQPLSFDRSLGDEREQTMHDVFAAAEQPEPEQALDLSSWSEHLDQLLGELTRIEAAVLRFRFGLDGGDELTLRDIGTKYNLSRERIRQIQEQALSKLRAAIKRKDSLAA